MKPTRVLAAAAFALPIALAAQQPAAPPLPANPVAESFRAFGAHYAGWLMQAFDSIPESKYGYKPTPAQQTFGYIAQHLEDANYQLCVAIGKDKHPMTARDSLADTVKAQWPKDTLVARLKASFAFCGHAVAGMADSTLASEVAFASPGGTMQIIRARFLIAYVTDLAEHYAQVASYMRLTGMTPPSALPRPAR